MKTLLIAPVLALAACVSPGDGLVPMEGPVVRTIERVLQRTEAYLEAPPEGFLVPEEVKGQIAAAILVARTMTTMPEASGDVLIVTMAQLMDLHDQFVTVDWTNGELDDLERDIYLEDTARLRSLFNAVAIHDAGLYAPDEVPLYAPSN